MRILVILLVIGSECVAQSSIDIFLSASVKDEELIELDRQEEYFQNNSFESPWLREVEIRTRSNDTEIGLEDYRLRFGLISPWEVKANRSHKNILREQFALDRENKINDILRKRYLILIEHYGLTQSLKSIDSTKQEYDKLRSILEDLSPTDQKDTWILLEEETLKLDLISTTIASKLEIIKYIFEQKYQYNQSIDWANYPLIDIEKIYSNLEIPTDTENIIERAIDYDLLKAASLQKIEETESWSSIGFIQAEYDVERGNDVENHLGFQLGVTLPIFNSDKPELQRDQLDLIEKEVEADLEKKELKLNKGINDLRIKNTSKNLLLVRAKILSFKALSADDSQEFDLKYYIKAIEFKNYLRNKELQLFQLLLEQYISLLHSQGSLVASPVINYLSSDNRSFKID